MNEDPTSTKLVRKAYASLRYPGDLAADCAIQHITPRRRRWTRIRRLAIAAMIMLLVFAGLSVLSQKHQHSLDITRQMNISLNGSMSMPFSIPAMSLPSLSQDISITPQIPVHLPSFGQLPSLNHDSSNEPEPQTNHKELAI